MYVIAAMACAGFFFIEEYTIVGYWLRPCSLILLSYSASDRVTAKQRQLGIPQTFNPLQSIGIAPVYGRQQSEGMLAV